jgi:hypothetical protein
LLNRHRVFSSVCFLSWLWLRFPDASGLSIEWPEIPQRAGKGGTFRDGLDVKPYTFQTLSANGSARASRWLTGWFQAPRSHEMAFPPVWRCGEAFRAFFGDTAL